MTANLLSDCGTAKASRLPPSTASARTSLLSAPRHQASAGGPPDARALTVSHHLAKSICARRRSHPSCRAPGPRSESSAGYGSETGGPAARSWSSKIDRANRAAAAAGPSGEAASPDLSSKELSPSSRAASMTSANPRSPSMPRCSSVSSSASEVQRAASATPCVWSILSTSAPVGHVATPTLADPIPGVEPGRGSDRGAA